MIKKRRIMSVLVFAQIFISTLLVTLTCESSIARAFEDQVIKTFQVKEGQLLYLKADMGSVDIKSWSRHEIKIIVTKKANTSSRREAEKIYDDLKMSFDQNRRGVTVLVEYVGPKRWGNRKLHLHFDICVPQKFDLDINTAGGSIAVDDLLGKIDLNTSGGSISADNIEGPLNAKTSGGSIRVTSATGEVDLNTSGGSITAGKVTGSLYAETSGGGIEVDGVVGDTRVFTSGGGLHLKKLAGNVWGSTSGGSIYAEITGQFNRDCSLKTSGGGITLYLARNIDANIDAHTSGGHVSTDFPVTVQGKLKSNSLSGKINNGGPLIELKTSGGSIRIKEW